MARGDFDTVITGAVNEYGREIKVYDDGYGPIWGLYDSMGLVGLVRASTFEAAYKISEDELFPEAQETIDELIAEYGEESESNSRDDDGYGPIWGLYDSEGFQEAYGFRPNGRNETDVIGHGIYQKDINGEWLVELGREELREQGIKIDVRRH